MLSVFEPSSLASGVMVGGTASSARVPLHASVRPASSSTTRESCASSLPNHRLSPHSDTRNRARAPSMTST